MRHTVIRGLLTATLFVISPTVLSAQENATFLMRAGERISGQLIDMGGVGFTVVVAGDERQVPVEDVVEIEFADPGHPVGDGDADQASTRPGTEGQPAVWLRNGEVVEGQLYDIDGSRPLRITLRTSAGERQFSSSEIRKIVLAASASTVGTSGSDRSRARIARGIDVPGNGEMGAGRHRRATRRSVDVLDDRADPTE